MSDYDCLIIGHNDLNFEYFVKVLRSMGTEHVDYKDLNLNYILYKGKPYRALDILTHLYYEGEEKITRPFHNGDLLWTVVAYLGTFLKRKGLTFDYLNLFRLQQDLLRKKLEENNYLTVAITATIHTFDLPIIDVISFIREHNKTAKIVAGGSYISKRSETLAAEELQSIFKYIGADFYVTCREGEQALTNIINTLKSSGDFDKVENIAYKKGDDFVITARNPEQNSLEENMVDYSLFDEKDINGFVNLRVSDGCPYACSFCGFPERADIHYKYMRVDNIEKELDAIRDVGSVTNLFFIDGTLNVPKKRFEDMLRMMIKNQYNFRWHCFFRCDQCDEEMVRLMKESGCEGVYLGLESASEIVLRNMNKTQYKKDFRKAMPLFKKAGINTFFSVIIGFPGETYETFWDTFTFIEEVQPDFVRLQMWYNDPTTPIWRRREEYGLRGNNFGWSHDTMDARIACDLVVKAFWSLENATWLHGPGYNWVSLYYMKKNGLPFEKQKIFLKCFRTIVKDKLLKRNVGEIPPELLENLRLAAQFDRPGEPDMSLLEPYSGKRYLAAEEFWVKEFRNPPVSSKLAMAHDSRGAQHTSVDRRVSSSIPFEKPVLKQLKAVYGAYFPEIILAAYIALLLRVFGREDTMILTSIDEKEVFPVRLQPSWELNFRQLFQDTQKKVMDGTYHRLFAFLILTNPLRMKEYNSSCPAFDVAFLVTDQEEVTLEERLPYHPEISQGIDLILRLIENKADDEIKIQFRYTTGKYELETIEKLQDYLMAIIEKISKNHNLLLKEMALEPVVEKRPVVVEAHASKDFNF